MRADSFRRERRDQGRSRQSVRPTAKDNAVVKCRKRERRVKPGSLLQKCVVKKPKAQAKRKPGAQAEQAHPFDRLTSTSAFTLMPRIFERTASAFGAYRSAVFMST